MPRSARPSASWPERWWASAGPLAGPLWRAVEAQHLVATMKLVDSAAEQLALERLLETSKPPLPPARDGQHFLLASPFRYPSPHPSRFRAAGATGIWYGAESVETACTELAHWRWRFLMDSAALRASELIAEFTLFRARVDGTALDLSEAPWNARRAEWASDDYGACQALAAAARERAVQWIRYASARHVPGRCGAVLDPACLSRVELNRQQTWVCKVTAATAFMRHGDEVLSIDFQPPSRPR